MNDCKISSTIWVLTLCGIVERNENGFGFWRDSLEAIRRSGICSYLLASTAVWTEFSSVGNEENDRKEEARSK